MKWEYMTLMVSARGFLGGNLDADALTARLDELGSDEWELVSMFDTNMLQGRTRDIVAVLKRPRERR